jgi:hypothetical protein
VAGRLVQAQAISGLLFYHQKTALALDNRGDCDGGLPDFRHNIPYKSRHFTVAGQRLQRGGPERIAYASPGSCHAFAQSC